MQYVLILTGTCGSGKTTISKLLVIKNGWKRISEDDIWEKNYGKNRGIFGTDEHRKKRYSIHVIVLSEILSIKNEKQNIVLDATVHELPPEAYNEYKELFKKHNIKWDICVLHPRLEVAIKRDSQRIDWVAGSERVKNLRLKFNGKVFPEECFVDNSDDTPFQTLEKINKIYAT